jgi:hypothetical protein
MAKNYMRRNRIGGQFSAHLIEMLESPAFAVLNLAERRILDRLEIELAHHGGTDNGQLPCTFDDFARFGVRRKSIASAVRVLCALGFVEVTERGRAGNGEFRRPHKFRLTYRHLNRSEPTHEWRTIKTEEEAKTVAEKNRTPGAFSTKSWGRKRLHNSQGVGGDNAPTSLGGDNAPTSRYRDDNPKKPEWSTPTLIEVTDPAEIEPIRRSDPLELARLATLQAMGAGAVLY